MSIFDNGTASNGTFDSSGLTMDKLLEARRLIEATPKPKPVPRIMEVKPHPSYRFELRSKKHRKKRRSCRVRVFAGWVDMIAEGEVFHDKINNVVYCNSATYTRLMRDIKAI